MTSRTAVAARGLREHPPAYGQRVSAGGEQGFEVVASARASLAEHELTALWLLGRVPAGALPWPLLRAGRAGRGPGPDVREALFAGPGGVPLAGDVEVHLRASDFARHGHATDPAYDRVVLHVCWEDDRPAGDRGGPVPLAGGGSAPTIAVAAPLGGDAERVRALLRRGPSGSEPCDAAARARGAAGTVALVRAEGQRRLAERTWQASRLVAGIGWERAWALLLDRSLRRSAGRRRESDETRSALASAVTASLTAYGVTVERGLALLAAAGEPRALVAGLRAAGLGEARAREVGWNAVLPLLASLAAAYGDVELARVTARLAAAWPAPRPYGRTRALAALLGPPEVGAGESAVPRDGGALWAQGLLHLQDLWCERGGCGVCPLSAQPPPSPPPRAGEGSEPSLG